MSIKNIIQQENDLQEMSPQSLANYLNNPTGQYNPYLVAGELQRKEQFAQRQMVEAPQETVVDELVQKTMPMGGMPMPRPQETMVSDTITETGIASLPAPNIGQNYAEGGIIGYDNGGEVDYFTRRDKTLNQGSNFDKGVAEDLAIEAGLMSIFGLPGTFMAPNELGDATLYDEEDFAEALANQDSDMTGAAAVGAGVVANEARKKAIKKKAIKPKIKPIKPTKAGIVKAGGVAALEAGKKLFNKLKPTPKKPLTKKQEAAKVKADKAAQKKKDALKGTPGAVDRAIKGGAGAIYTGAKSGLGALGRGMKANPIASTIGLGLGGLGAGMMYNAAEERKIQEESNRLELEAKALEREAIKREQLNQIQASLDAQQAARDKRREKEMYLALALGGAKTMAGQSQFALTNIGEGLGAGVGALAAYDQNEIERMTASQAATIKARQDMQMAMADYENDYRDRILELDDNEMYNARLQALEDYGYTEADLALAKEALLREFVGLPTNSYFATINGQQFTAAE